MYNRAMLDRFLDQLRGQSRANRRNYRLRITSLLRLLGGRSPAQLNRPLVNAWHSTLVDHGYAPATLAGYRQAVKAFCRWLVEEGVLEDDPAAHLRTGSFASSRSRRPGEAGVQAMVRVAEAWLNGEPEDVRAACFVLVSYETGARHGEIRTLRHSVVRAALDAGPDEFQIYRMTTTGKTGRSVLRFSDRLAYALRRWLAVRPAAALDRCFVTLTAPHKQLARSTANVPYRRIAAAAGLPRPIYSHAFRHRLGHLLTKSHGPRVAAMMLNHAHPERPLVAMQFYYHPDEETVSRALSELPP